MRITSNLYLRIISGQYRGRKLARPPKGTLSTRPMMDRIRESLFDILSPYLSGAYVLDLCAGTGSIGLEALSRGSKHVTFVEKNFHNIKLIEKNIKALSAQDHTRVLKAELPQGLKQLKGTFDLIFLDPPFDSDLVECVVPKVAEQALLSPSGLLVIQRRRISRELQFDQFVLHRRHRVGDSDLWFFNLP